MKRTSYVKASRLLSWVTFMTLSRMKEMFTHEWLGEEIRHVVRRGHKKYAQFTIFDTLADEVVSPLNMFDLGVVLQVVGEVDRRLVVQLEWWRLRHVEPQLP